MEKSKRVVGYARVSTEAQDITRQIELITAYCSDRNYHLIKIIQEKISGARKDRKSLNELLDVDDAVADMIIVSELSRLSREDDILSVLSTINELLKQGVDILFLDKQDRIYKAGTILYCRVFFITTIPFKFLMAIFESFLLNFINPCINP